MAFTVTDETLEREQDSSERGYLIFKRKGYDN